MTCDQCLGYSGCICPCCSPGLQPEIATTDWVTVSINVMAIGIYTLSQLSKFDRCGSGCVVHHDDHVAIVLAIDESNIESVNKITEPHAIGRTRIIG